MESRAIASAVALVGYGKMGRAMGRRLLTAGYRLTVFDLDPVACRAASSPTGGEGFGPPRPSVASTRLLTGSRSAP